MLSIVSVPRHVAARAGPPAIVPDALPPWLLADLNLRTEPAEDFLTPNSIRQRKLPLAPSF